jgi:hypothetical protein
MKPLQLFSLIPQILTVLALLVPVAEYLFDGEKRGPEKRAYVLDQASGLLSTHVHPFFGSDLGRQLLGLLVDGLVSVLNR